MHASLRPHRRADQRAGDRAAGRGAPNTRDLPRPRRAHGLRRAVLRRRATSSSRAPPSRATWSISTALRERGWVTLPLPDAPFADGGFPTADGRVVIDAPGLRRARPRGQLRKRLVRPAAGAALSAGDDLAAGAQLPQLELRQREEPARHRGRAAAGDSRRRRAARGIVDGAMVRVFNDRGSYRCTRGGERARPARRRQRPGHLVAQAGRWTAPTSTSSRTSG